MKKHKIEQIYENNVNKVRVCLTTVFHFPKSRWFKQYKSIIWASTVSHFGKLELKDPTLT